jgi:hypothetical protein
LNGWKILLSGYVVATVLLLLFSHAITADSEPNNSMEEAETITLGQEISGSLDVASDEYDFYNITLEADQDVVAVLDGPENSDFDLNIYDSDGTHLAGSMDDIDADEMIKFKSTVTGYYFISIWAYDGSGAYTMSMSLPETTPNDSYTINEAIDNRYIDVEITGVYDGSREEFDLKTGINVFYLRCIEITIESFVSNDLDIVVPAGLQLISNHEDVENKIVTLTDTIDVNSFAQKTVKLLAMSINMNKAVPNVYTTFEVGTMATGDLLKIAQHIDSPSSQSISGQIAIWMVTDDATSTEAQQLGATSSQISSARNILEQAGVEPPKEDDSDNDDGFDLNPCNNWICLTIIIILVALFVLGVIGKISDSKKTPPQTAPPDEQWDPYSALPASSPREQPSQETRPPSRPPAPPSNQSQTAPRSPRPPPPKKK